jgi:hypothetical protein
MACFTCGKDLKDNELAMTAKFKNEYTQKGTVRYAYRLGENKPLMFVREESFEAVFKRDIKPKLKKGAEYCHIKEFSV